jgi:hypothetical protein
MRSMMSLRRFLFSAAFLLFTAVCLQSNAKANDSSTFDLTVSDSGQDIAVTVTGKNVSDLYAYDMIVRFDPLRLKLIGTKSKMSGFSVEPIVTGSQIRFAHTKTGSAAGIKGTADLAVLTFERIRGGDAPVMLLQAKLVDSKLKMVEWKPGTQAVIAGHSSKADLSDIAGHWAESTILEAVELGFISGYPDVTFRPDHPVTREELTAMLVRALLLSEHPGKELDFIDRDKIQPWALPFVNAAVQAGLINGYEDHSFRGSDTIVRQELAAVIVRAMGIKPEAEAKEEFADNGQMDPWAKGFIAAAAKAGIMSGRSNHHFAPTEHTTRAEAATVILKLIYSINN